MTLITLVIAVVTVLMSGCAGKAPLNPKAVMHQQRGAVYLATDKLDEAEANLALALEYNPHYPEAHNGLGLLAYRRGNQHVALNHFRDAITYNADFAEAHNNVGVVLLEQHDFEMAAESFKAALGVDPGYKNARYNLALTYMQLGNWEQARAALHKLLAIAPKWPAVHAELGCLMTYWGKRAEAELFLQRALAMDHKSAAAHRCTGHLRRDAGDLSAAEQSFRTAIATDAFEVESMLGLGLVLALQHRWTAAAQIAETFVRRRPGRPEGQFVAGFIYSQIPQHKERAVEHLQSAIELVPDYAAAHLALADLLDRQPTKTGDLKLAETHYRLFLRRVPVDLSAQKDRVEKWLKSR